MWFGKVGRVKNSVGRAGLPQENVAKKQARLKKKEVWRGSWDCVLKL
jgi:hypothetical protein